jgi:hypothetical protein
MTLSSAVSARTISTTWLPTAAVRRAWGESRWRIVPSMITAIRSESVSISHM